ncbi:MAG TPA: hypothetical protein DIW67_20900 [Pseudomonas sp.]|nr:hypothetical protein [Pseudomonas sp.]
MCISQIRHQYRSLAAPNALALRTRVIVLLTIPTSHLMGAPFNGADNHLRVRWSGLYTLIEYKNFKN